MSAQDYHRNETNIVPIHSPSFSLRAFAILHRKTHSTEGSLDFVVSQFGSKFALWSSGLGKIHCVYTLSALEVFKQFSECLWCTENKWKVKRTSLLRVCKSILDFREIYTPFTPDFVRTDRVLRKVKSFLQIPTIRPPLNDFPLPKKCHFPFHLLVFVSGTHSLDESHFSKVKDRHGLTQWPSSESLYRWSAIRLRRLSIAEVEKSWV